MVSVQLLRGNVFEDHSESMSEGFVEDDGGGFVKGLGSTFV